MAIQRLTIDPVVQTTTAATVYVNSDLGTVAVKVADASTTLMLRHVVVTNSSASAPLAYALLSTGTTTTPLACSLAGATSANDGIRIFPGTKETLNLSSDVSLWLAASAGSTPVHVAIYEIPDR